MCMGLVLAGCATTSEPTIRTVEVKVPVPVACPDRRGPAPTYPDTDEVLKRKPGESQVDHLIHVVPLVLAGRELRDGRLGEDDAQIGACTGAVHNPPPSP